MCRTLPPYQSYRKIYFVSTPTPIINWVIMRSPAQDLASHHLDPTLPFSSCLASRHSAPLLLAVDAAARRHFVPVAAAHSSSSTHHEYSLPLQVTLSP